MCVVTTTWQCKVTETHWWQVTWESDSLRPRHPRALDNEELFVIEGSQKITWRNVPTEKISAKYKGLARKLSRFPCISATEASTVHTSQCVHAVMTAIVRNTARGAISPAKPAECMPLPGRRQTRPLPLRPCMQVEIRIDQRIQSFTFT